MPNPNWSKKSNARARTKALADGRILAQGVHEYYRKCPLIEICDNVQYNARNSSVWCADNPNERRVYVYGFMEVCEFVEER